MPLSKSPQSDLATDSEAVPVREAYVAYQPPTHVARTIRMLLRYVPTKYLGGLAEILLTNSGSSRELRRSKTKSRKRSMPLTEALGLYRRRWNEQPAMIVIHVERLEHYRRGFGFVGKLPAVCAFLYASTLYHEIGHHIHSTRKPEYREREDVADQWQRTLLRDFARKRYWYLIPLFYVVSRFNRWRGLHASRRNWQGSNR